MNEPPRFVLVAEDRAHAWLAITLADRLTAQEIGWLNEHQDPENKLLPDWARTFAPKNLKLALRVNQDALPEQTIEYYIDKHDIPKLYKNAGVPLVNRPGATPLTRKTVRALRYFKEIEADASALVMMFDTDEQASLKDMLKDLSEATNESYFENGLPFSVIFGVCHPEAEAWFLCAFEPEGHEEEQRVDDEKRRLGFHPCEQGHQLSSGKANDKKDAKRVLGTLSNTQAGPAALGKRALRAIRDCPLDLMVSRGEKIGLRDFMDEVAKQLLPHYQRQG